MIMTPVFAHHMGGEDGWFPSIEVNEKPFPDGPTEHAIVFGVTVVGLMLMGYGAFALVRDLLRWRRGRPLRV